MTSRPERLESLKRRSADAWALWSILAAQATLTLPWMWRTSAYTDEALYLKAAQAAWPKLLAEASSFPGLPVIYPPLAGAFESVGGLIGARILSLLFMLGATTLVYLMGDRMFGRVPGLLAALLFAVCGIVVHLGAAATFDPMALFLLVLALFAGVKMRDGGVIWVLICPIALAAANATKYATIAWDPLIVGTIILYGWSKGRSLAIVLGTSVLATTGVIDFGILLLGGANLAEGVLRNTVDPSAQVGVPSSAVSVLGHAMLMTGLILLIALAGIWVSFVKRMPGTATAFLCLLVLAALLAPIEQARVHEINSLDENMGFGLPFAALGAGYALGAWRQWLGRQRQWGKIVATTAAAVTVITMLIVGRVERVQFRGPGSVAAARVANAIRNNYQPGSMILVDGAAMTEQYNVPAVPKNSWISSSSISAQTHAAICFGYVSVIVIKMMEGNYVNPADEQIAPLVHQMYLRKAVAGKGKHTTQVWALRPHAKSCRAG